MRIALDVDGVLAQTHEEWLRRYNRDYNDVLRIEDITEWDWLEFVKRECGIGIYDYLSQPDFYDSIHVEPGAIDGVAKLRKKGHEVIFVTSCVFGMVDQKARWLERFGFIAHTRQALSPELVIATDKTLVKADILVDDKVETIDTWVGEKHGLGLLYKQPWNERKVSKGLKMRNWQDVVRTVGVIDKQGYVVLPERGY